MHEDAFGPPCAGRHLLIDLFGASGLGNLDHIRRACLAAARATGATVLSDHFHHFGEGCGVSGVVVLAESHLSVHTWPENGYAAFDVFVCGTCDPLHAVPVLEAAFAPTRAVVQQHARGEGAGCLLPPLTA